MAAFRRVDPRKAGPQALGILVPPGVRTLVILRPRGLPWDLLPARWTGSREVPPEFCAFGREEAARLARRVHEALEQAVAVRINPLQTVGDPRGETFQVWLRTDEYVWIVCEQTPGKAYRPALFKSPDEAEQVGDRLTLVLWPAADAKQELYFNTQQFA